MLAALLFGLGKFLPILLPAIQSYAQKRVDLATDQEKTRRETELANIAAEVERRKVQRDIIIADQGWWVTRWMRPAIAYPFILHVGAIALDSTFRFGWAIPALPDPYDKMEWTVIGFFFLMRPIEKVWRQ